MSLKTYETKFEIGQVVYYNAPFTGSVAPRFQIIALWITDIGSCYGITYDVRQLFDHLEYERREGISTQIMQLKEHELSAEMLKA